MYRVILTVFLLFVVSFLQGQTVVLSEDLRFKEEKPLYGMNRKHYRHFFLGLHFMAGEAADRGSRIHYGRSFGFEYGYRYKRRFNNTFSAGYELVFKRFSFAPRQEEGKLVPGPSLHDREKLVFLGGGIALYKRVNYGRRGDYIGRFFDLGAYADWYFHARHVTFDKTDVQYVRVRRTRMDYPRSFGYGTFIRAGLNHLVFKATYRVSDLFTQESGLPEFPRWSVGLELGLHPF